MGVDLESCGDRWPAAAGFFITCPQHLGTKQPVVGRIAAELDARDDRETELHDLELRRVLHLKLPLALPVGQQLAGRRDSQIVVETDASSSAQATRRCR